MANSGMSEIEEVVEQRAIERVIHDYSYYLDMNQPDNLAALFVDDCEVSYAPKFGAKGMEEYKKTLEGIGTFFSATSHHNSGIVIDFVSPAEADIRTIVMAIHRYTKERPDGILYGQYFDKMVKVDDQWKFIRRELRTTLTTDYHVKAANPIGRAD